MSPGSSIILGTAQFGMPYGVANQAGQMDSQRAAQTIRVAREGGIRLVDTAIGYGQSEAVLGGLDLGPIQVMTKLPAIPDGCADVQAWVRGQVAGSLGRLHVDVLHGLSLHRPGQLLESQGRQLHDAMVALKDEGVVENIGISIYEPGELGPLLEGRKFDIVQAPFNILDRRLQSSGWLDRLNVMGIQVHARSIFLQGLLLLPESRRPPYFLRWRSLLSDLDHWFDQVGNRPMEACLRFALATPGISKLVVGVDGPGQLQEIVDAADGRLPELPRQLSSNDRELLNPALWANP